jgi:hypothetical protein
MKRLPPAVLFAASLLPGAALAADAMQNLTAASYRDMDAAARATTAALATQSEPDVVEATKQALANSLKDPGSAQFRNTRLVAHPAGMVVCGEVNAKNSHGGYVGFRRFFGSPEAARPEITSGATHEINRAANSAISEYCTP